MGLLYVGAYILATRVGGVIVPTLVGIWATVHAGSWLCVAYESARWRCRQIRPWITRSCFENTRVKLVIGVVASIHLYVAAFSFAVRIGGVFVPTLVGLWAAIHMGSLVSLVLERLA